MKRLLLLGFLAPAAWGQLQFYSFDGTNETLIPNNVYSLPGPFVVGVKQAIRIRVHSPNQAVCLVLNPASMGTGFSLDPSNPSLPAPLAVGSAIEFDVDFLAPSVALSASANFELRYLPLSQANGCSGPGVPTANLSVADLIIQVNGIATGAVVSLQANGPSITSIPFGNVAVGQKSSIRLYLSNPSSSPIIVHLQTPGGVDPQTPVALDSAGAFMLLDGAFPLTLSPSAPVSVDLQFSPAKAQPYAAALVLGSVMLPVTGNGAAPAFTTPTIVVDTALQSGTQPSLSITLPAPAPAAATGTLFLVFQPSAGAVDDPAIHFLTPAGRQIGFSFNAGDTTATIGTAKSVQFQTGTTAGALTFSATFQTPLQPVTATIPPATIGIDSTIANIPNDSQATILLNGFDNTKSVTQLAFTFYTVNGTNLAVIPPGKITYDATRDFSQFFQTSTAGGMFALLAQFPVNGMAATSGPGAAVGGAAIIHSVDVEITNSAGTTTLTQLLFSQCSAAIVNNCTTGTGCPCP
jgi:hypothetical protein